MIKRKRDQHEDPICARIDALLDNRDYTELEHPASQWQRWAYFQQEYDHGQAVGTASDQSGAAH